MNELTLTTPALLFSAISLILLAYTNRFLGYASIVRTLYDQFKNNCDHLLLAQINNLRKRLYLIRIMQLLGVASLFLCVVSMFFLYIERQNGGVWAFGIALLSLISSLGVSMYEINISVKALELNLTDMEKSEKNCTECEECKEGKECKKNK